MRKAFRVVAATLAVASVLLCAHVLLAQPISNSSPLSEKARYLQRDLREKHLEDGLYVSIVPVVLAGTPLTHTVDEPGNVIHAGVWTGRYLAGVGYQYAVTHDPAVRKHGGELLAGLRRLQEVTSKPGLLARGYVKGHGPVELFERGGGDSREWHQGQGAFADYRFYSDVSVDNFNAVLYGYAIYFDLAADGEQKKTIAHDVDRMMTHLLDNHYRIIDLDGKVTQYGHVGLDPDPSRDDYYKQVYKSRYTAGGDWRPFLRASLMALPDLLIAYHITGKERYMDEYRKVITRFAGNPEPPPDARPFSPEKVARVNHSSEGQAYEALFNLMRYEKDPALLTRYGKWLTALWDMNWMEGNPLYTYMTVALLPKNSPEIPHADESLKLSMETLQLYPVDRVMHPVMNSIRKDIEISPFPGRGAEKQAIRPVPIDVRPLDNEYAWKGNPYALDGWLKPTVTAFQFSCDDPLVAWFSDSAGHLYMTRDGMKTWRDVSWAMLGAHARNVAASPTRTFVLHAATDQGILVTQDGGMSWRKVDAGTTPALTDSPNVHDWRAAAAAELRIDEQQRLVRKGKDGVIAAAMDGWRIPLASWLFTTPRGILAGGPGGAYLSADGQRWSELKLWREDETGPADYLHAYWMGRYYGLVK